MNIITFSLLTALVIVYILWVTSIMVKSFKKRNFIETVADADSYPELVLNAIVGAFLFIVCTLLALILVPFMVLKYTIIFVKKKSIERKEI